jgi:hypothetical protein
MTYGVPAHDSVTWPGGELEQIQFLLGHASVQTTEHYLGCKQKLRHAVNDNLGLEDVWPSVHSLEPDFWTIKRAATLSGAPNGAFPDGLIRQLGQLTLGTHNHTQ